MKLSPLSLGTWTFAGDSIWSDSSEAESIDVILYAAESGICLFDTAPNYGGGRSEAILGKALGNRDGVTVASKCKIDNMDRRALVGTVDKSLRTLRREAIDLMQVHWPASDPEQTSFAIDVFSDLKREGKIVEIGACNFGVFDLEENGTKGIVSNQLPYSLMWRVIEEEIAGKSAEAGLAVIAYSPLQQGLLTGRYQGLNDFPPGRRRTRHFRHDGETALHGGKGMERETRTCLEGFLLLSGEAGMEPVDLALGYIFARGLVDSVLTGARTVEQLKQLIRASERKITPDLIARLDIISDPLRLSCGGNPDMYGAVSRVRHNPLSRLS